ncbi:MAG: hypothetical protein GY714_03600, partial [Desulfobacterales bacterium]|nr:hypothetical protein [Desulfobacterales bacterium]
KVIEKLSLAGHEIIETSAFDNVEEINKLHRKMIAFEFAEVHRKWFSEYPSGYSKTASQLIQSGEAVSKTDHQSAKKMQTEVRNQLHKIKEENQIDLFLSPSSVTTAPKGLDSTGDPIMNLPWTFAGLPTFSIPSGEIEGLPFGIQLAEDYNQDENLFELAKQLIRIL